MLRLSLGVLAGIIIWFIANYVGYLALWWNDLFGDLGYFIFFVPLLITAVASTIAGFVAVSISLEKTKTLLILTFTLTTIVVSILISHWDRMQLWYHLAFLVCLVPMLILGGIFGGFKRTK